MKDTRIELQKNEGSVNQEDGETDMDIQIYQQLDGAKQAKGTTVIIDVFRAFTLECYLMAAGAGRILPVGAKETAYQLKESHPDFLLVGERHGVILPGFDFGNSPSQTRDADLHGKTIVHTTSAGTQGVANAKNAEEILGGSLVNARAIAHYLRQKNCEQVSLVCMGLEAVWESPEDTLCARYIKSILEEQELDMQAELAALRHTTEGSKFFDPATQSVFPEQDYWMCTDIDKFDFVLKIERLDQDLYETHKQILSQGTQHGR